MANNEYHNYNNMRGALPPLERLQQRNRQLETNINNATVGTNYVNFVVPESGLSGWGTFGSSYIGTTAREIQEPEISKWVRCYNDWAWKVKTISGDELNSAYGYFKYQNKRSRSIEPLLLEAIANHDSLVTKTTTYDPEKGTVSLHNVPFARIDMETFKVKEIEFPIALEAHIKLLRHRLRQLGVRCIVVKGINQLYLTQDNWVPLKLGSKVEISPLYNLVCLPKTWYSKSLPELPKQSDLFGLDWKTLSQYDDTMHRFPYKVKVSLSPNSYHFKGSVVINDELTPHAIEQSLSIRLNSENHIIKYTIEKLKERIEKEVEIYIRERNTLRYHAHGGKSYSYVSFNNSMPVTNITTTTVNNTYWTTEGIWPNNLNVQITGNL